jgi:hypothetical protein
MNAHRRSRHFCPVTYVRRFRGAPFPKKFLSEAIGHLAALSATNGAQERGAGQTLVYLVLRKLTRSAVHYRILRVDYLQDGGNRAPRFNGIHEPRLTNRAADEIAEFGFRQCFESH